MDFDFFDGLLPPPPSDFDEAVAVIPGQPDDAQETVQAVVGAVEVRKAVAVPLPSAPAGGGAPQPLREEEAARRLLQRVARGMLGRKKAHKRKVKANNEKARRIMAEQHRRVAEMVSGWSRSASSSGASSGNPKKKSCHLKKCKHCGTGTGARAKICANEACKKPFESVSKWAKYKRKARSKKKDWDSATKKQKAEFALKQLDKCFVCQDPVNYNATTTICTDCNTKMCVHCAVEFANSMVRSAFPIYLDNPNYVPQSFGKWKKPCACQKWCKFPVVNPVVKDDGTKPSLDADDRERMKKNRKTSPEKPSSWDLYFNESVQERSYVKRRNKLWIKCQELGLIRQDFPSHMQLHQQFEAERQRLGVRNLLVAMRALLRNHGYDPSEVLSGQVGGVSGASVTLVRIIVQDMKDKGEVSIGMHTTKRVSMGIYVDAVAPNSPAARAHMEKDMIITELKLMKRQNIQTYAELSNFDMKVDGVSDQLFFNNLKIFLQNALNSNTEVDEIWFYAKKVHVL